MGKVTVSVPSNLAIKNKINTAITAGFSATATVKASPIYEAGLRVKAKDLPWIFYKWPITASMSISRSFEGHPSGGSLKLIANKDNIEAIRNLFIPGQEVDFYGMGFRVTSFSESLRPVSQYPIFTYDVSISLGGKWEHYANLPLRLNTSGIKIKKRNPKVSWIDCNNINKQQNKDKDRKRKKTNIATLLRSIGVCYTGVPVEIEIPDVVGPNEGIDWLSAIRSQLRHQGHYLFLSDVNCIRSRNIYDGKTYNFTYKDAIAFSGTSIKSEKSKNWSKISPATSVLHKSAINTPLPLLPLNPNPITIRDENTKRIPLGTEYKNAELTGGFLDRQNDDDNDIEETKQKAELQQPPKWKLIPSKRISRESGKKFAGSPPAQITQDAGPNYDLSLNFDMGGLTKSYTVSVSEDGNPISEETYTFGFTYLASDINGIDPLKFKEYEEALKAKNIELAQAIFDELYTAPLKPIAQTWTQVRYERTDYLYHPETGYLLGIDVTGNMLARYKQEDSSQPQTVHLPIKINTLVREAFFEPDEKKKELILLEAHLISRELQLYKWFTLPIRRYTRYFLEPFAKYYKDSNPDPTDFYEVCLASGAIKEKPIKDPSFVEPYFCIKETMEAVSFAWTKNLEGELRKIKMMQEAEEYRSKDPAVADEILQEILRLPKYPPYTTGEETYNIKELTIYPKDTKVENNTGFLGIREVREDKDRFVTETAYFNSLDAGFGSNLSNQDFTEEYGRPSVHTRKGRNYERIEPEAEDPDDDEQKRKEKAAYRYTVNTCEYGCNDITQGSVSYPNAKTLQEALVGAKTDLYINNVQSTLDSTFTMPLDLTVEEWDRVVYIDSDGIRYKRRIISVNHNFEIQGLVDNVPFVKGTTTLQTGLDRPVDEMCFSYCKKKIPNNADSDRPTEFKQKRERYKDIKKRAGDPLGEVIPFRLISRLNF